MDVILAAIFTEGKEAFGHPRGKLGKAVSMKQLDDRDRFEYIKPLYQSIHRYPGLKGVFVHDSLSADFVRRYSTDQLSFWKAEVDTRNLNFERRFFGFRDLLRARPDVERVWLMDINDAAFTIHPFRWWDELPLRRNVILVGEEFTKYGQNAWFKNGLSKLPGEYQELLLVKYAEFYPLTVGTWGTTRTLALRILDDMIAQFAVMIDHLTRQGNRFAITLEMHAFASTLLRQYRKKIATFHLNGDQPKESPGVSLRHFASPVVHDRRSALAYLESTSADLSAPASPSPAPATTLCRWRTSAGKDAFLCHSPKFIDPPNPVALNFCATCCHRDHKPVQA